MAQFHPLKVSEVRKTIRDAVVVSFDRPSSEDFDFIQGQYLTFRQDVDGTEIRRSYSICSGKDEDILQVAIKKVAGGAFSTWANETLQSGMTLEAMPPSGNFHTTLSATQEKHYLAFAGGSGITPVLSILKTTLAKEPNSRFTLVYANRSINTIMFREELEDLKNEHMGRLNVIHILENGSQDISLFAGRVDQDKCAALFDQWINIDNIDTAFICGPEPMMLGIVAALKAHGLNDTQIKFELFAASQVGRLERSKSAAPEAKTPPAQATIIIDGVAQTIEIENDQTVLEAALANALDAPFACKAGVCSTCKCKVLEGEVEMIANHALEDYEVAQGFILSCQSFALSKNLKVDYDQH